MWLVNTKRAVLRGHIRLERMDEILESMSNGMQHPIQEPPPSNPGYAILSHTWDEATQEVSFSDLERLGQGNSKRGFVKIRSACQQALRDGFLHIWIDTCCIDQRSSSELQEAINSMFRWYSDAAICYVYLSDFSSNCTPTLRENLYQADIDRCMPQFGACRWFTRGWTLQELIAPTKVAFFDRSWTFIGEKSTLVKQLSAVTKIDPLVLENCYDLSALSIAKRMSWAAKRKTKRIEDQAYCLLGILGINMTMLYGEGEKAFARLQRELISVSADCSIFLSRRTLPQGLLATSPVAFELCHDVVRCKDLELQYSYELTQRGMKLDLPLLEIGKQHYLAILPVRLETDYQHLLAVHLAERGEDKLWGERIRFCAIQSCSTDCRDTGSSLDHGNMHFANSTMLTKAKRSLVLIPWGNFTTRADFSVLKYTSPIWIP